MTNELTRSLIERLVRIKLGDLKQAPERTTRNLVDMALHFSTGRFQKHFFEIAQEMLHNENSAYYELIHHLITHVDTKRLLSFGMNVGYNSFTYGAKLIRKNEASYGFNIPWCITLEINPMVFSDHPEYYHKLFHEGKSLGIYTWNLFCNGQLSKIFPLLEMNDDCAFLLFCKPEELTEYILSQYSGIHNFMFVVKYNDAKTDIFSVLKNRHFLYSVFLFYDTEIGSTLCNAELLCYMARTDAVFAFLLPEESCTEEALHNVCLYTEKLLQNPTCKTLPFDFLSDNRRIDSIISDDACCAFFNEDGQLSHRPELNYYDYTLSEIFQIAFPKMTSMISNTIEG